MANTRNDMKKLLKNTKNKGEVTIFTYKEGGVFVSVCLELDLLKEGKDLADLKIEMLDSVMGYVETVCKENLPDESLNRPAPKKYWTKYYAFLNRLEEKKQMESPARQKQSAAIDLISIPDLCPA